MMTGDAFSIVAYSLSSSLDDREKYRIGMVVSPN